MSSEEQFEAQLATVRAAIPSKPPYCYGTIPLPESVLVLFYGKQKDSRRLEFPNASQDDLEHLARTCDVATFGVNNESVTDETYRKAGKLDNSDYATTFNIADSGLVKIIREHLLEGEQASDTIRTELYNLNVYGPGGFFRAHKDTPRSEDMFGSLVLVLPTRHEGGDLTLRDGTDEWTFDSAKSIADGGGNCIGYVAFYSDVEHEVKEVKSGYRVTLTYNLYFQTPPRPAKGYTINENHTTGKVKIALDTLLNNHAFLPEGGYLGFGLRRDYPLPGEGKDLGYLLRCLKGSDAAVWQAAKGLGLDTVPHLVFDDNRTGCTVICDKMPRISHWSTEDVTLARYLKTEQGGRYIQIYLYRGDEELDLTVHWVTPMTKYSTVSKEVATYGNCPSVDYVYGTACLIVQVGPPGERATRKEEVQDSEDDEDDDDGDSDEEESDN